MRPIRFRAWIPATRQMLRVGQIDWQGDNIVYMEAGNWKVNPTQFTIMQFTGLKDKNAVDIYEGDIVHIVNSNNSMKGVVFFDPVTAGFVAHKSYGLGFSPLTGDYIVVIGNAFEHTDILANKNNFI